MRAKIQKTGYYFSSMILPNIGVFIAYGLLQACFSDTGWFPNAGYALLISTLFTYIIPVMIASSGGRILAGNRGAVLASISVTGAILSDSSRPMIFAAMLIGPCAGHLIRWLDKKLSSRIPAGYEMLYQNLSLALPGCFLAICSYHLIGPACSCVMELSACCVGILLQHHLLPLIAVFIEPAKIFFLNNAINHSIFTPMAATQAQETGSSILYMIESNPGPGLGILCAFYASEKDRRKKKTLAGSMMIQFLGGIHEIYFPYILECPILILAAIVGNAAAILWFSMMNCGLSGPASPGSILSFLIMSPFYDIWKVMIGIFLSVFLTFHLSMLLIRTGAGSLTNDKSSAGDIFSNNGIMEEEIVTMTKIHNANTIKKIIFACDVGMGSSAMGAHLFRRQLADLRPDITVEHMPVDTLPQDADLVITQEAFRDRASHACPHAQLLTITQFLDDPELNSLLDQLSCQMESVDSTPCDIHRGEYSDDRIIEEENVSYAADPSATSPVLRREGIRLGLPSVSQEDAITAAGRLLVDLGYVQAPYIDAMHEREALVTTYMGMGLAVPHGTLASRDRIFHSGIVFLQYPDGIDYGSERVELLFAIAGKGEEHFTLLGKICDLFEDEEVLSELKSTTDTEWVYRLFL